MHAEDGTLTLFASGPEEIYLRCIPIFKTFTTKSCWVGESEEARYLKLLHNAMLGVIALMLAEALAFGQKGGLGLSQMLDVLNDSVVTSPVIGYKTEAVKHRTFDLTFTASQMAKDLDLALSAAGQLEVPMPLTAIVRQFMGAMTATGRGEEDFFAVLKLMEELAGVN
jgi:3-hydroxyisobutyrate dehydrogenase-like beta-hydroxyacid dehydrogenase